MEAERKHLDSDPELLREHVVAKSQIVQYTIAYENQQHSTFNAGIVTEEGNVYSHYRKQFHINAKETL